MKCDQCGSRCDINSEELLTKSDILNLMKDIKQNIGTDVMINISGGEPLMRQDIFEIMTKVTAMGFDWGMVTNGVLLTPQNIKKLKKSGLKTITISIDGLRETHDALRHYNGAFDKIINGIRLLKAANFLDVLQVTFTANKKNIYDFPELYSILENIGISSIRTSFIDPIGRAEDNIGLMLNKEEMQYLIDFANAKNKEGRLPVIWGCPHYLGGKLDNRQFNCFTGKIAASILYNGDIFVCPNVPRRPELIQGSIKTDKFSEIWKRGFKQFRQERKYEYCNDCKYYEACRGDSLHTYDFEADKPKFCYKDIFDKEVQQYESYTKEKYKGYDLIEIDPGKNNKGIRKTILEQIIEKGSREKKPELRNVTDTCYIEPEAYNEIKQYFHTGQMHPSSMYEQQMGLIGFKINNDYVIRYVFPSHTIRLANDKAVFSKETLKQVEMELGIVKRNLAKSGDKDKLLIGELKFLGFIHSHPVQKNLQYSTGDVKIHKKLVKKYNDYIGLLIHPKTENIGGYYNKDMKQIRLRIIEKEEG